MKNIIKKNNFTLSSIFLSLLIISGCEKGRIIDFDNDRILSGTVKDEEGNIVPGDIASENLAVYVLGETETKPTIIRVKYDGTYENTRLFYQKYKVWLSGPAFPIEPVDTVVVDFTNNKSFLLDWKVVPYLTIDLPVISGDITATSVNISYNIKGNNGKTADVRELYCSTSPYPNTSTGSGPGYSTKEVKMKNDNGVVAVPGLSPGTKYYLRIGARAAGAGFNFSDQITFTTLN